MAWSGLFGRNSQHHDIELSHRFVYIVYSILGDLESSAKEASSWMLEISKPLFTYSMMKMGYTIHGHYI